MKQYGQVFEDPAYDEDGCLSDENFAWDETEDTDTFVYTEELNELIDIPSYDPFETVNS